MIKFISSYITSVFLVFSYFVINQETILAAEVDRYMEEHNRIFHLYDVRLSSTQGEEDIDKPDQFILHIDCNDLKTLQPLQKPLYDLDLSGEEVSIDRLRELLPISSQILSLNLMETYLKDNYFPIIEQLTELKSLILSDNPFSDIAMRSIPSLRNLRNLEIVHTKITGSGLKNLLYLKMIERLDVGCNLLKNEGIRNISKITSLVDVDVRACDFDEKVLPLFFNLPNLKKLNISNNKFEKRIFEDFIRKANEKGVEVKAEEILYTF